MGRLLTSMQAERVQRTIAEVEQTTAGEIVCCIAQRCDDYSARRAPLAAGITIATALALFLLFPSVPGEWILAGEVPFGLGIFRLLGVPFVLRCIVPRQVRTGAVEARARQLFIERGVTETRDRSGVLLLVSEWEAWVTILADKGIHARVGIERWQQEVEGIVKAVRAGNAVEGLCKALRNIGAELSAAFPPRADDRNELPDAVVRVKD